MEDWKILSERRNVLHFHNVHDLTYCIYWGRCHIKYPLKSLMECIGFMFGFRSCLNNRTPIHVVFLIFVAKIRDRRDKSIEFHRIRSTFWTRRLRLPRQLPRHAGGERWIGLARILQVQVDPRRVVLIQRDSKQMEIDGNLWKFSRFI